MLKTLSKFFCFNLLFIFVACAPKPMVTPPLLYEERELTLEDVIAKVGNIEVLKAIADINIERNDEPYSFVSASVLIKKPGWLHMRMYQLGILVRDFVIKDDTLYVLSGKNDDNLKKLGKELYSAIFWWDGYSNGAMSREGEAYLIRTDGKEILLNKTTLLPIQQEINTLNKNISVRYEEPADNDGFRYPSKLIISVDDFKFTVRLKKFLRNPALGEADFQIPAGI